MLLRCPLLPFPPLCSGTGMESTASPCTESHGSAPASPDWAAVGRRWEKGTGGSHPGVELRVGWFLGRGERALLHTKQRQGFQSVQEPGCLGFISGFLQRLLVTPAGWEESDTLHLGEEGMGRRDPQGWARGPLGDGTSPAAVHRVCMCVRVNKIH